MLTRAVDEGDDSDESGSFEDDESGEDWDELERKAKKCTCGSVCGRVITDPRGSRREASRRGRRRLERRRSQEEEGWQAMMM